MSDIKKRTFSLPPGLSDFIDAKVKSGNYANSSEVVRAGLRALQERDSNLQHRQETKAPSPDTGKQSQDKDHPIEGLFDEIRARNQ